MKRAILTILTICFLIESHSAIWYVNLNASGANNGTSWTDAYVDLQSALASANFGDQIWVAMGTYKPTATTTRSIYFDLKNGVAMYGGFIGGETLLAQRDFVNNSTILSGNIGSLASMTDNSYHVVRGSSVGNQTRLDGFTVTQGHANAVGITNGGGIYLSSSSPIIANCKILDNFTDDYGGGLYTTGTCTIIIKNCGFYYNVTNTQSGAGMYIGSSSNLTITDSEISYNQSDAGAGGAFLTGSTTMDRCIISGNNAATYQGGLTLINGTHNIYNTLIIGNVAQSACAISSTSGATTSMINCTVANNRNLDGDVFGYVINGSTNFQIKNCIIWDNLTAGGLQMSGSNSNVYNCIIQGGYALGTNIINQNPLFVNGGNSLSVPFDTSGLNYHVQVLSPGIDYGNNTYVVGSSYDLDSSTRIQNVTVDLGSYESNYCNSPVTIAPGAPFTICNGNPLTLSVPGGTQFIWSTGSTSSSINISTAGTYSVVVEDTAGCRGSLQAIVTTSSSPTPTISYSGGNLTTTSFTTYQWFYEGDTIIGATSNTHLPSEGYGTYSVAVTNSGGCVGTDTYCYSPVTFFTGGPTTFCNGGSVTLWVTNGNTFAWSNSETDSSITVSTSGTYSVTVTNAIAGCSVDFQQVVTVNPNPNPIVTYSGGAFHTTAFSTYQWYFNGSPIGGATSMNLTPTNGSGAYSVTVTNSLGCTGTSTAYNYNVGIEENDQVYISIYPNPVSGSGIININTTNSSLSNVTISLIDMSGKKVFSRIFEVMPNQISLDNIKSGIYILAINSGIISKNYRIVVL